MRAGTDPTTQELIEQHLPLVRHVVFQVAVNFPRHVDRDELATAAKELGAPVELVRRTAALGALPVVNFSAGGIATPADAALMMQLGADGNFVGSGIFKSEDPAARARAVVEALGTGERGRYLVAFAFGNVHGVYNPSSVHLRPEILGEIQRDIGARTGTEKPFDLVFHGGSGSSPTDIAAAVGHGVVKMNIDTDTQYAFTRPAAAHMFSNYDGVLKVDGEVGNKKAYDPRAWGKLAEAGMARRVVEACEDLRSSGTSLNKV